MTKAPLGTAMPQPFALMFNERVLSASAATILAIDSAGTILWLNPAWSRFSRANGGEDRFGVGSCYFDGISGPLRAYFVDAFARVLQTLRPFELDYECSSAEVRRLMRLRALPVAEAGLLLEHSSVREQPFLDERAERPSPLYVNSDGLISQCSNCRKVRRTDTQSWDWVPRWVSNPASNISHGICDVCYGFYWKNLRHI